MFSRDTPSHPPIKLSYRARQIEVRVLMMMIMLGGRLMVMVEMNDDNEVDDDGDDKGAGDDDYDDGDQCQFHSNNLFEGKRETTKDKDGHREGMGAETVKEKERERKKNEES